MEYDSEIETKSKYALPVCGHAPEIGGETEQVASQNTVCPICGEPYGVFELTEYEKAILDKVGSEGGFLFSIADRRMLGACRELGIKKLITMSHEFGELFKISPPQPPEENT